jgi:hypothetical protein
MLLVTVPQLPLWAIVTVSATGAPVVPSLTVTVTVDVLVPLAGMVDGLAEIVILLGTATWWIVAVPLVPFWASCAVMVQSTGKFVPAVNVTLTCPSLSVVPNCGATDPSQLAPETMTLTGSPATGVLVVVSVTVTWMVVVLLPSAGMLQVEDVPGD